MKLLPRTLFGRLALVIAVLLAMTQMLTVYVIDAVLNDRRAEGLARLETDRARLVFAAHAALPPPTRAAYREQLVREHGILLSQEPAAQSRPVPAVRFIAALADGIHQRMGAGSEVRIGAANLPRGLWIKAPQQPWWAFIPNAPMKSGFPWEWVASIALALGVALAGALLLVWRINRPLRRLAAAASALGQGQAVVPVADEGPEEIRRLGTQFNQMIEDLRRLDDERKLLLAGISHDMRTPLTRLRLGLEMLDPKAGEKAKNRLIAEVETVDAILEQFLALGQGGQELPGEFGNLNELVQHTAGRYAAERAPPSLTLAELPMMRFHSLALQRLLTNLVNNAYRHGGGEVEIETRQCGEHVRINIRDRGPGVAEQHLGACFSSLAAAHLRAGSRHGFGLAIAQRMAQAHHGRFTLRNRAGGGLDAEVDLPLVRPEPWQTEVAASGAG